MPSPAPEPNEIGQVCPTNETGTLSHKEALHSVIKKTYKRWHVKSFSRFCDTLFFFSVLKIHMLMRMGIVSAPLTTKALNTL